MTNGDAVTADADRATRTQAAPQAEAQAAAGPRGADSIQPATVQIQVCSVELKDAASNLPVGHVDSGGITDTASRTQDAPAEGGQQRAEAHAAAPAPATMQPVVQVQVCSVELNDTAANLLPGSIITRSQPSQTEMADGCQTAAPARPPIPASSQQHSPAKN